MIKCQEIQALIPDPKTGWEGVLIGEHVVHCSECMEVYTQNLLQKGETND